MGDTSKFIFLKHLDKRVVDTFNSAFLMWENRNTVFYQQIQQYCELLLKEIIAFKKKTNALDNKPSLGNMLDNRVVLSILEYDLELDKDFIHQISYINKLGNESKHNIKGIKFIEDTSIDLFEICYELTESYLIKLKSINVDSFDKKLFSRISEESWQKELDKTINNKQLNNSKETDEKIEILRVEIEKLQRENLKLKDNDQRQKELEEKYESLKVEFYQKTTQLENLEKEFSINPDNSDIEEKLSIASGNLEDIENEIKNTNKAINASDVLIKQNETIINENKLLIERYTQNQTAIENAISENNSLYDAFTDLLSHYKVSFDSCYLEKSCFSITDLEDVDKSGSKYASFYAVIFNQLIRGNAITPSEFLLDLNLKTVEYQLIYKLQIAILMLIRNNVLKDEIWEINLVNDYDEYLDYAIRDVFNRLEKIIGLTSVSLECPRVIISNTNIRKDIINISIEVLYPTNEDVYSIINDFELENLSNLWIDETIKYSIINEREHQSILNTLLLEFFGFREFRTGQIEILINTLNGKNTIGILTTSGGKSLIYQFAALMQPKITIIVDPIIALINDQYRKLTIDFGIHRTIKLVEQMVDDTKFSAKQMVDQLFYRPSIYNFSTPERFQNQEFRDWLIAQSVKKKIGLIVLDEVHCLSEWGHDFRISYLMLSNTINTYCSNIQYLGLTATAAINVIKDLQVELGIYEKENIVFAKKLQRDNLDFNIFQFKNYDQMNEALGKILEKDYSSQDLTFEVRENNPNGVIVFFKTKKNLSETLNIFRSKYNNEITEFHGDEKSTQDDFIYNRKNLLFATKAFGMGIDKPNVRKTIHFGMPSSREAFFQEAGRAGRDGNASSCILLTFESDPKTSIYVSKFLDLNTQVSDLSSIMKSLGFYDKNDLSTIAYFMTLNLETPEKEAENAIHLFDRIETSAVNLELTIHIDNYVDRSNTKQYTEGLLYILHKVGIIRTWTINYITYQKIDIKVYLHPDFKDIDHIKTSAINYLNQYAPNPYLINKINAYQNLDDLRSIIIIVREWYQNTFLRTKREQLANMVEFIERYKNRHRNVEIQNEMSQFFDISRLLERRDSKLSLTFDNTRISDVVKRSSKVKNQELNEIRVNMERLIETEESSRINLFTALIHLRLNMFNNRNGKDRLTLALSQSTKEEIQEIYRSIKPLYDKCAIHNQLELLEYLYQYNKNLFLEKIVNEISDENTSKIIIKHLNSKYDSIF